MITRRPPLQRRVIAVPGSCRFTAGQLPGPESSRVSVSLARACACARTDNLHLALARLRAGLGRRERPWKRHEIGGRMPDDTVRRLGGVTRMVPVPGGRVHLTDDLGTAAYLGTAAPLVLMHGFPDDSRVYD